jgi:hypothetical protein
MTTARNQDVVFTSYIGYDYSLSLDSKLGCNLSNTPIISTYPTAPTASKGTYIFDDNGSTKILTAGGSNDKASINFDVCSTSTAPYSVLFVNKNGLTAKAITAYDGSSNSQLTTSGIFFNGKNYKVSIENNETNISTILNTHLPTIRDRLDVDEALLAQHTDQISNLSAVDVTELAKLSDLEAVDTTLKNRLTVIEEKQPIIISTPIYHVPAVYADSTGRADYIPSAVSAVTSYSGLYYKNNLNQKINWYIPPDNNLTVGDIKALMLNFYNVSSVSGLGCPFVAVYTKTDTITPNSASWYKSRKTFSVDYTSTTTINTSYALLADLKGLTYDPLAYGHTKVSASTIPGNDKGSFADSEKILFFSIGTSSNSTAGLFEFIASKFTILTSKSSQEFVFQQL